MGTTLSKVSRQVLFLSGAWPGTTSGYAIANYSTLRFFYDRGYSCFYIGPAEETLDPTLIQTFANTTFLPVDFTRKPKPIRFLRSLFSSSPAITERFWNAASHLPEQIHRAGISPSHPTLFFYEDIPAGWLMKHLKPVFPGATHLLRSHNVVTKGFEGMAHSGSWLKRSSWHLELKKIRLLEKELFRQADQGFAISTDDALWYEKELQIRTQGVVGCMLEESFFESAPWPDVPKKLLYLGSADLRKGDALHRLIREGWPLIRMAIPDAELILGGRGTEAFHRPDQGITGMGFIEDEKSFLTSGEIFLNPQQMGAGIKLKSLVAAAAGKLLISTSVGVEGTGLKSEEHSIVADTFPEMAEKAIWYLKNPDESRSIAERGRSFVRQAYSKESFYRAMERVFPTSER